MLDDYIANNSTKLTDGFLAGARFYEYAFNVETTLYDENSELDISNSLFLLILSFLLQTKFLFKSSTILLTFLFSCVVSCQPSFFFESKPHRYVQKLNVM